MISIDLDSVHLPEALTLCQALYNAVFTEAPHLSDVTPNVWMRKLRLGEVKSFVQIPGPSQSDCMARRSPSCPRVYVFGARHEARSSASDPPTPASCPLRETRTNCYPHFADWEVEAQEGTAMAPKSQSQSLGAGGGQGSHSQARASRTMPSGLPPPPRCPSAKVSIWLLRNREPQRGSSGGVMVPRLLRVQQTRGDKNQRGNIYTQQRSLVSTSENAALRHSCSLSDRITSKTPRPLSMRAPLSPELLSHPFCPCRRSFH